MSALSNCGDGCDYALVPGSGSGTHFADEENGNYKAASDAITFTPTLENDNVPYTFYVYAHEDHDFAANCSGTMAFVKGSTCKQVDWNITGDNSNSASPSPNYPWKSNCATITTNRVCLGQVEIKAPVACENKTGTWNGVSFQLQGNGPPTKNFSTNPAPSTTNNLVINDCDEISSVYMTGCSEVSAATAVPSIDGCPTSALTVWPRGSISLPMTISNCSVIGGCEYTISASGQSSISGTIYGDKIPSFTGASVDHATVTYSLSISNSKGSATTCTSFNVAYDSDARIDANIANNGNSTFGPGKYKLYCDGNSGTKTMQPYTSSGSECNTWFDPSITTYSQHWGSCNWQASVSFPINLDVPAGETIKLNCW
jgi:hypothetical protein